MHNDSSGFISFLLDWGHCLRVVAEPLLPCAGGTAPREMTAQTCGTPASSPVAHTPLSSPHHHTEPEGAKKSCLHHPGVKDLTRGQVNNGGHRKDVIYSLASKVQVLI